MLTKVRAAAALTAALAIGATACAASPGAGTAKPHDTVPRAVLAAASLPAVSPAKPRRFSYLDLFPFKGVRDALAWEAAYRNGGHSPWHLSPGLTALAFTQGYLGFRGIGAVTSQKIRGADADVGVGFRNPDGRLSTAAVLHLRRLGTGPDAPWEVVGSEDSSLTITRPGYGSQVTGKTTAGGTITGVDESLHLWVRGLSSSHPLGEVCCIAAGGQKQPWTAVVRFSRGTDRVLTVIVATGGHVAAVERFAITAVRTS